MIRQGFNLVLTRHGGAGPTCPKAFPSFSGVAADRQGYLGFLARRVVGEVPDEVGHGPAEVPGVDPHEPGIRVPRHHSIYRRPSRSFAPRPCPENVWRGAHGGELSEGWGRATRQHGREVIEIRGLVSATAYGPLSNSSRPMLCRART
jgi:hypothetical protein